MQDRNQVTLPKSGKRHSQKRMTELTVVKVLEFSSQTLRSGVVAIVSDGLPGSARLFLTGAPAVIRDLVQPSSLPADFDEVQPVSSLCQCGLALHMCMQINGVSSLCQVCRQLYV